MKTNFKFFLSSVQEFLRSNNDARANLDEMVFEDRNKEYGAYILRKNHNWYLATAVTFVSSVFLYVCFLPVYLGWMKEKKAADNNISICCCIINEPLPEPIKYFYPPQADQIQSGKTKKIRTVSFQIPIPAPEKEITGEGKGKDRVNSIIDFSENAHPAVAPDTIIKKIKPPVWQGLNEEVIGLEEKFYDLSIPGHFCEEEPEPEEFIFAEAEPVPINLNEIVKLFKHPQPAHDAGIYGTTVFRILVDRRGNYVKHITIKKVHPLLTNMLEAHIPKLKFTPAIQGGKAIPFWVNIPFRLEPMR